jgi:hypothetical protein
MTTLSRAVAAGVLLVLSGSPSRGQGSATLPAGLEVQTRHTIEVLADSLRAAGLPVEPLYAKVAEGKLKQATDVQIIAAVRGLARRFRDLRSAIGAPLGAAALSAASTALSSGVPMPAIVGLFGAAGTDRNADADFTTALITLTDLVEQRVPPASATTAVQSLLARRAPADQYARLRVEVRDEIGAGRSPDQAVRARADAIVRSLPMLGPPAAVKPL